MKCKYCKREFSTDKFYRRKQTSRGYSGYCKECYKTNPEIKKNNYIKQEGIDRYNRTIKLIEEGNLECSRCNSVKPFDDFYRDARHLTGYMSVCKECHKIHTRGYVRHRKDKCEVCGFIPVHICQLDVDHINGDHSDNREENLQTLCANCHRLKTTGGKLWEDYISNFI